MIVPTGIAVLKIPIAIPSSRSLNHWESIWAAITAVAAAPIPAGIFWQKQPAQISALVSLAFGRESSQSFEQRTEYFPTNKSQLD